MNSTLSGQQTIEYVQQLSRIVSTITLYGTIFIVFPGLVMNAFNLYIFNRNRAFTPSVRFFYTFQSLNDINNLINCIIIFFPLSFGVDVGTLSDPICKLSFIMRRFAAHTASWSQVMVSFDRVFSIMFSVKYKNIEGKKYRWTCAALPVLGLLAANMIGLYYTRTETRTTLNNVTTITYRCVLPRSIGFLVSMLTSLQRTVLPFSLMILFNTMLVYSMHAQKRKMQLQRRRQTTAQITRREFNFAIPIIALNSLFLLLNTPLMLQQFSEFLINIDSDEHRARINLYRIIGVYCMYAYSALTFLFYTAFNKIFRREVLSIFYGTITMMGSARVGSTNTNARAASALKPNLPIANKQSIALTTNL
jgi:hypothetical protein